MNIGSTKEFLRPGLVPFALAAVFTVTSFGYSFFGLPSAAELATIGRDLYLQHGLLVLLGAALLEGVFMVNLYLPGSFVIVLSVFLSDKSLGELSVIAAITWLGFWLASVGNYFLGSSGLYRLLLALGRSDTIQSTQKWIERRGEKARFIAAVHPNLQAVYMVCAGIARDKVVAASLKSAIYLALWVPLWTIFFAMVLKKVDIEDSNTPLYVIAFLLLIGLLMCFSHALNRPSSGDA
jgi:membrane protein DedA with SNARE-associated domain